MKTLTKEDLSELIRSGSITEGEVKVTLKFSPLIVEDKDVKPCGTGSYHAYIPIPVGRKFKTVHIIPGDRV